MNSVSVPKFRAVSFLHLEEFKIHNAANDNGSLTGTDCPSSSSTLPADSSCWFSENRDPSVSHLFLSRAEHIWSGDGWAGATEPYFIRTSTDTSIKNMYIAHTYSKCHSMS